MKAGELRHQIFHEAPPIERLPSGGIDPNKPWTPVYPRVGATSPIVRARVDPLGGTEIFGAGVFNAEATHRVTERFFPGLTTAMRINFQGRLFGILSIVNIDEMDTEMVLLCVEGRSHGTVF